EPGTKIPGFLKVLVALDKMDYHLYNEDKNINHAEVRYATQNASSITFGLKTFNSTNAYVGWDYYYQICTWGGG
ncbi:MAG: hypothetical protein J6023_05140, partial [Clostridia bacterium]|nr:hypothetical protein [Clostridia bacterium]